MILTGKSLSAGACCAAWARPWPFHSWMPWYRRWLRRSAGRTGLRYGWVSSTCPTGSSTCRASGHPRARVSRSSSAKSAQRARAVSRASHFPQRLGAGERSSRRGRTRRSRPSRSDIPDGSASCQDGRPRNPSGRFRGPDRRARIGQAHSVRFARDWHRGAKRRRRLRFGL